MTTVILEVEHIDLKPGKRNQTLAGNKNSTFVFTIPDYFGKTWTANPVDLRTEGQGDRNEYIVMFYSDALRQSQHVLRMILQVDSIQESYRLSLYSPFWILNSTDKQLEFQIEGDSASIEIDDKLVLVCPEKFLTAKKTNGGLRLSDKKDSIHVSKWSEKFSISVVKSTGNALCEVPRDRTYIIHVSIETSSFGCTRIIILSPLFVIINKSTVDIEVIETIRDQEIDDWKRINCDEVVPFWSHDANNSSMCVRYAHNRVKSHQFMFNRRHKTLLHMNDAERPAIHVEVTATDFDGVKIIFSDYKTGDAPVLLINCLTLDTIAFCQVNDIRTEILPPMHFLYYAWMNPILPRKLAVSCGSKRIELDTNPQCGNLGNDDELCIHYAVFIDGLQTIFMFSDDENVMAAVSGVTALVQSIGQRLQISIHDVGLSIVNDLTCEEIAYVSLNRSNVIWTEVKRSRVRPLGKHTNMELEILYKIHKEECETNHGDTNILRKKYSTEEYPEIIFHDDLVELIDTRGKRIISKRRALDGLWIEYSWSKTSAALQLRINHMQIDNQLDITVFPVALFPVISKKIGHDVSDKPFFEMSAYETKSSRSNVTHFKYFKLLVQEFAVKVDHGLLAALVEFLRLEKDLETTAIDIDADLKQVYQSFEDRIKEEINVPLGETEMFFDYLHLSPLKIHLSFSIHGSNKNEQLFARFPLITFLLETLNVAEVEDVVLNLNFYERIHDRCSMTKLTNEISHHYQSQFMRQIHVFVLGLDVLGNPFGVFRDIAEGFETFFYEPYKGAVEGPLEFIEGLLIGIRTLLGAAIGGTSGAASKITGAIGKGLATLTFDEEYKGARIKRKNPAAKMKSNLIVEGKQVVMGFVGGVQGVVSKPVKGAKATGARGFVKGLGQGTIGLIAKPTGSVFDFASASFDMIKRVAKNERVVHRIRFPRYVGHDGLVRPYVAHEAIGYFILGRLASGKYAQSDVYVAHIITSTDPVSWLMVTSKRLILITAISYLDTYVVDWEIEFAELQEEPIIKPNLCQIQILTKRAKRVRKFRSSVTYGKMVNYRNSLEARYIVEKIINTMQTTGF